MKKAQLKSTKENLINVAPKLLEALEAAKRVIDNQSSAFIIEQVGDAYPEIAMAIKAAHAVCENEQRMISLIPEMIDLDYRLTRDEKHSLINYLLKRNVDPCDFLEIVKHASLEDYNEMFPEENVTIERANMEDHFCFTDHEELIYWLQIECKEWMRSKK